MAAGNDGKSVTVAVRTWDSTSAAANKYRNIQLYSADNGISWEKKSDNIFDVDFKGNSFIYIGDDAAVGALYRRGRLYTDGDG